MSRNVLVLCVIATFTYLVFSDSAFPRRVHDVPVPSPWEVYEVETGNRYYYNPLTQQSTWDPPRPAPKPPTLDRTITWGGTNYHQDTAEHVANTTRGQTLRALALDAMNLHKSHYASPRRDVCAVGRMRWEKEASVVVTETLYQYGSAVTVDGIALRDEESRSVTDGWSYAMAEYRSRLRVRLLILIDSEGLAELTSFWTESPTYTAQRRLLGSLRAMTMPSAFLPFRVLTYNIWNFNPPWVRRLQKIGRIVSSLDPSDVIAWQEVRYDSDFEPTIGNLSLLYRRKHQVFHLLYVLRKSPGTPYNFVFRPAMTYTQNDKGPTNDQLAVQVEGLALFSPHLILRQESRLLTKTEGERDDHQRVCLGAALLFPPWGLVHIFNTHMSLSLKQQVFNMREIVDFINDFGSNAHEQENLPLVEILVGDMNAVPKDARWLPMLKKEGFVDAWEVYRKQANIIDPGYTFNNLYTQLHKLQSRPSLWLTSLYTPSVSIWDSLHGKSRHEKKDILYVAYMTTNLSWPIWLTSL